MCSGYPLDEFNGAKTLVVFFDLTGYSVLILEDALESSPVNHGIGDVHPHLGIRDSKTEPLVRGTACDDGTHCGHLNGLLLEHARNIPSKNTLQENGKSKRWG